MYGHSLDGDGDDVVFAAGVKAGVAAAAAAAAAADAEPQRRRRDLRPAYSGGGVSSSTSTHVQFPTEGHVPGYTGHTPAANERYGRSFGRITREVGDRVRSAGHARVREHGHAHAHTHAHTHAHARAHAHDGYYHDDDGDDDVDDDDDGDVAVRSALRVLRARDATLLHERERRANAERELDELRWQHHCAQSAAAAAAEAAAEAVANEGSDAAAVTIVVGNKISTTNNNNNNNNTNGGGGGGGSGGGGGGARRVRRSARGHEGRIPGYGGHVPFEQGQIGKSFGRTTRNAVSNIIFVFCYARRGDH
jgi:hypothetical protein